MNDLVFRPAEESCRVAVVILNYKTPELALQAARHAADDVDSAQDRVLIVDNKSPDNSVELIKAGLQEMGYSHVSLIESPVNGGFSAGNNVGIRAINAEAYLLLNSDTIVRPGAIPRLWATLQSSSRIGITSPRLQYEDDEPQVSCFRQHSPLSELIGGAQTGPLTKLLKRWEVPIGVKSEQVDVPWTSFACVLVRREVFEQVGLMDEGYFMYFEDADFCRLATSAGFRVVHDPGARVVHLRGKSSPVKEATRLRKERPRYYYNARNRFFLKNYGPLGAVAANGMWTLGRLMAIPRELVGHKDRHTVKNEFRDNWKGSLPRGGAS